MRPEDIKSTPIFRLFPLYLALSAATLSKVDGLGVNWGTAASHPLPPREVVELLKANDIAKVKLFDADPKVLQSLAGSGIRVTVGIPNSMLRGLNLSLKAAENWVHDNLTRFVSEGATRVLIDYVAVGDEPFLQSYGEQFYPYLIGAATNIQTALLKANLGTRVKVVAPCSHDTLSKSNLPSKARFRPDINRTMTQLLTFLDRHESPFFVSISPFQSYRGNKNFSLDFALFRDTAHALNDTREAYKNIFDLSFDTVTAAVSNTGFPQMEIVVSQIGWPTDGAPNATTSLAKEFLNGLTSHLRARPAKSSKHQVSPAEVYILSLLDEDERSTASGDFERHWGLFTFDGQAKYQADLGQGPKPLVNARDVRYLSARWCVVDNNKDLLNATSLAREACAADVDCTALSPGSSCSGLGWPANISYVFNSFYQQHDQNLDSCDFGGLGLVTTVDPSVDSCRFSVGLSMSFSVLYGPGLFGWMVPPMTTILLWVLRQEMVES